jgi:hypothetical protein
VEREPLKAQANALSEARNEESRIPAPDKAGINWTKCRKGKLLKLSKLMKLCEFQAF